MQESYKQILRRLRQISIVKTLTAGMLSGHVCRLLSPYCSAFFIKRGVTPNQVTVLMMVFGIVGSFLFMIPNIWCKIAGYVCWYLWFTMDLSDGEVARYTKTFSRYGEEMDFMAHLIDHPLMNIALWMTFLQMWPQYLFMISLLFIISISGELLLRNIMAFYNYLGERIEAQGGSHRQSLLKYLLIEAVLYPNVIVLFTPLVVLDYWLELGWTLYLYILWFTYFVMYFIRATFKFTCKLYNSESMKVVKSAKTAH